MIPLTYGPLHMYAQAGLYIACPHLFKTGQGRRKKDEKWTREKFFFIFGNFVCGDVREEVGVWKLDVDILEMCREFEVGGGGPRGLKGSCSLMMEILVCYHSCVGTSSLILDDSY